jgi:hypothetical protein
MKTWAPDTFEDSGSPIVDTSDVSGGNRDKEASNDFIYEKRDYQFIKISHSLVYYNLF